MLAQLHDMITIFKVNQALPAQVLLSSPVVFLDARGRCARFHLEFIDTAEVHVLLAAYYVGLVKLTTML